MTIFLQKYYTDCMYKFDFCKKQGEYFGWVLRKFSGLLRVSRIIFIGEYSGKYRTTQVSKLSKFGVSTPAFSRCTQGEYSGLIYKYIQGYIKPPVYLYIFLCGLPVEIRHNNFFAVLKF